MPARTTLALLGVAMALASRAAHAHPLGNLSTNRWAALRVGGDALVVDYAVDLAEVPAARELAAMDADGDGTASPAERDRWLAATVAAIARDLHVTINGAPLALAPAMSGLETASGAGGLATLRLDLRLRASLPARAGTLVYRDDNFAGRPGWQELIATAADGTALAGATVPSVDRSQALRAYPADLVGAPPQAREATLRFAPGAASAAASAATAAATAGARGDRLTELVATRRPLDAWLVVSSLAVAAALGALHALSPGHGKTVVGAYLVGTQGTTWHAVFLGLVVTATHTVGVYVLGLLSLVASQWVVPERLLPWLGIASGLLVVGIGATLVVTRLAAVAAPGGHDDMHGHSHDHHHGHGQEHHHHDHGHSHAPDGVGPRSLVALGVSGGLLPCPSALVVMLGAIALGRIAFGLALIVAFSAGLAAVLTAVGILMVRARRLFERLPIDGRVARYVPVASAVIISMAGIALVAEAIAQMRA